MEQNILFARFGAALLIGILIGLQREYAAENHQANHSSDIPAGVRTFPLLSLAGCVAALLSDIYNSPLPLVVTVLVAGGLMAIHYVHAIAQGATGLTTKSAAILTILAGALAYTDKVALAIAVGVITTLLLSAKTQLHGFVRHLTKADVLAILKFAVITAIILPVLPNKTYGPVPIHVFNPFKIWLLVVFISAISFIGYVATKVLGSRKGIRLIGLLGGIASSTAVTLSIAQLSREHRQLARPFASAIIIAWTIMFVRVILIICAFNMSLVGRLWLPMTAAVLAGILWHLILYFQERADNRHGDRIKLTNPFELGPAIKFGIVFTLVLAVAKAATVYLGTTGTYVSSFLSGLADVDAITLSLVKFSVNGSISMVTAANAVVIASIANTLVKGGIVLVGGSGELKKTIVPGWILMMAAAGATLFVR